MNNKQNMPASSSGKRRLVGLDRWLLPALGTPWRPGRIFQSKKRSEYLTTSAQH